MKDSLRRMVLFITIVGIGSAMIFVDIPLVYMLLLIVAVGFILLLLLGTITVAEIKNAFSTISPEKLRKRTFFGKPGLPLKSEKKPSTPKNAGEKKDKKTAPKKPAESSGGIRAHMSLLVSSMGSLGKILTDRSKPRKKVEDIDKLLEHTITEKVSRSSALESAAVVPVAHSRRRAGRRPTHSSLYQAKNWRPACWTGWMSRSYRPHLRHPRVFRCLKKQIPAFPCRISICLLCRKKLLMMQARSSQRMPMRDLKN